jgi:integrase
VSSKPSTPAGTWIAADAAVPPTLSPEIALARVAAVEDAQQFFDPRYALRAIQALAPNTRRGYAADWSAFLECCRSQGFRALPASSSALQAFIEWRSPEQPALTREGLYRYMKPGMPRQPVAASSLRRALAAVAAVHRVLKYPDPTEDEDVRATLKINVSGRQVQSHKDPLRWDDLERAFARMGEGLWALRDKALAAVGLSTGFRRSELVALRVEDYVRTPSADFALMMVGKTKTEDPKELKYRPVVPEAVRHLEAWLQAVRITEGPLFRGITPDGRISAQPLTAGQVARAYKSIGRRAGLSDVTRIAGHSTRIGLAHDLDAYGASDREIMQAAGWKSLASLMRYLQGRQVAEGAVVRMARARNKSRPEDGPTLVVKG